MFGQSSLHRAFETYLSRADGTNGIGVVERALGEIIRDHDLGKRPDVDVDPVRFMAFCYAPVIRSLQDGVMVYDCDRVNGRWDLENAKKFEIKDKYVFNLEDAAENADYIKTSEDFIKQLKSGRFEVTLQEQQHLNSDNSVSVSYYYAISDTTNGELLVIAPTEDFEMSLQSLLQALKKLKAQNP